MAGLVTTPTVNQQSTPKVVVQATQPVQGLQVLQAPKPAAPAPAQVAGAPTAGLVTPAPATVVQPTDQVVNTQPQLTVAEPELPKIVDTVTPGLVGGSGLEASDEAKKALEDGKTQQTGLVLTEQEIAALKQQLGSSMGQLTALQQEQQASLAQTGAQLGLAGEVKVALKNNLLAKQMEEATKLNDSIVSGSYTNALTRLNEEQTATKDRVSSMLAASLGNPEAFDAWLQTALSLYPDDPYYQAIAADPSLLDPVWQQGRAATIQANVQSASAILDAALIDPSDVGEVSSQFQNWVNARWAGDARGMELEASAFTPSKSDIESYAKAFGPSLDPNDETDRQRLYAWNMYLKQVKANFAGEIAGDLAEEVKNLGVDEMTTERMDQIRDATATLVDMTGGSTLQVGDIASAWDPDLQDGKFSIYFTDWSGNAISDYASYKADPLFKSLDQLWEAAVKAGVETGTRSEFRDRVTKLYGTDTRFMRGLTDAEAAELAGGMGKNSAQTENVTMSWVQKAGLDPAVVNTPGALIDSMYAKQVSKTAPADWNVNSYLESLDPVGKIAAYESGSKGLGMNANEGRRIFTISDLGVLDNGGLINVPSAGSDVQNHTQFHVIRVGDTIYGLQPTGSVSATGQMVYKVIAPDGKDTGKTVTPYRTMVK